MSVFFPTFQEAVSVPYKRMLRTSSGDAELGNVDAVATFRTAPGDLWQFLRDCMGSPVIVDNGSGPVLTRRIPVTLPENSELFAYRASFNYGGAVQFDPATAAPASGPPGGPYGYAEIKVGFRFPPFDPAGSDYGSCSKSGASSFITLPNRVFRFGDGTPTGQDVGIWDAQVSFNYRRHWVANLPAAEDVVFGIMGSLNSDTFLGRAPGTLLLLQPTTTAAVSTTGMVLASDLDVTMIYRPRGHNAFLHPDGTTGFAEVYDGNGDPPYPSTAFAPLAGL
jgi:hypothetical protein